MCSRTDLNLTHDADISIVEDEPGFDGVEESSAVGEANGLNNTLASLFSPAEDGASSGIQTSQVLHSFVYYFHCRRQFLLCCFQAYAGTFLLGFANSVK